MTAARQKCEAELARIRAAIAAEERPAQPGSPATAQTRDGARSQRQIPRVERAAR
jgi:hypothetical protein